MQTTELSLLQNAGVLPDHAKIRSDFPALHQEVYGVPLVYLDNAATSQKPRAVIERLVQYYQTENSNVHRGVHFLSQQASDDYERSRDLIARFINAPTARQVIFTRGTTDAINLVASSYGRSCVSAGDEIIISMMEHHSNIVPWQLLCEEKGARLRVIPITERGEIIFEAYESLLNEKTRVVAIAHVSNALGTINPVRRMIETAHAAGVPVLVDGAQAVPHGRVDVQALDCDFYCFSGHKMFGPTGAGVLFGKEQLLENMPPYQGGGDMIDSVSFEKTTFNVLPHKFEAGTPNIAGVIGLGAAVEYMQTVGLDAIASHERYLLDYATRRLLEINGLRIIGTAREKASVVSFLMEGVHPYDAGTVLDRLGIAVRTGHHCTQPLMHHYGIPGTVRASFAFYNNEEDVDALVHGLNKVKTLFA